MPMHQVVTPPGLDRRRTRHCSVSHALVHSRTLALLEMHPCTGLAYTWEKMKSGSLSCPVLCLTVPRPFGEFLCVFVLSVASESLLSLVPFSPVLSVHLVSLSLSFSLLLSFLLVSSCQTCLAPSPPSPFLHVSQVMRPSQQGGVAWLPRRCFRGAA
ncbi:hypothetical protein J3F84DRAFT_217265 [Trichoderma pleuroticola]